MGELKRRSAQTPFEPDDRKRLKRFHRMLFDDSKKDAVLNVNGVRVPVHHAVLVASSPSLALLGNNTPITGSSVESVRHFVRYLYGFNVFEDRDLTVEEALELTDLFIQFDIGPAAIKAARYCLRKSRRGHLNKLCRMLGNVKEIRVELAEKIAVSHDCVDLSLVDTSTMKLLLASLRLTEIQKLVALGKWVKLNSRDAEMKQLFGAVDLEYSGQAVKEMNERLMNKNWKISALEGKLITEEEKNETLAAKLKEKNEKINALTIALERKEKEIITLQFSHQRGMRQQEPAVSRRDSQHSRELRQSFSDKLGISRITQVHENTTSTTEKTSMKSLSILQKRRMLEADIENNKPVAVEDVPSAKGSKDPENNEVTSGGVGAEENGGKHSLLKVIGEDVTKDSSKTKGPGKEIFYARTVPHVYKMVASSSSEDNDSDCGSNVQNEGECEFKNTSDEIDNVEVSKPPESNSDVGNTTYETAEKEREGADGREESSREETHPSSSSEALDYGSARHFGPVRFSDYVSNLQLEWEHPSDGQPETIMLHLVRAVMALSSMTQKSVAKEVGLSQSSASRYLRGKFRGNLQLVEEKLAVFVQKYLEENGGMNAQIASNIVSSPIINTEIPVMKSPAIAADNDDGHENKSEGPESIKKRASMPPLPSASHVPSPIPPLEKFRKVCVLPSKSEM